MALTEKQKSVIRSIRSLSGTELDAQHTIQMTSARYFQEDIANQVTDEELAVDDEFKNLTIADLVAAMGSLMAVDTTLGDFSSGHAGNLLKVI